MTGGTLFIQHTPHHGSRTQISDLELCVYFDAVEQVWCRVWFCFAKGDGIVVMGVCLFRFCLNIKVGWGICLFRVVPTYDELL